MFFTKKSFWVITALTTVAGSLVPYSRREQPKEQAWNGPCLASNLMHLEINHMKC